MAGSLWTIAAATAILGGYRAWRQHRNSLPDGERAQIFWNDERYEATGRWVWRCVWAFIAIMLPFAVWLFGLSQEWWCWPMACN